MKNRASLLTALRSRELWAADHHVVFDLCWNVAHRSDLEWTAAFTRPGEDPRQQSGPVRVIPVHGMLEPRASALDEYFGVTSLQAVRDAFRAALRDPSTRAIVLDVDSPGGSVAGVTELASEVRAARGGRVRIVAVADTLMASAAYWIASQADEVVASPSASVGSIGIIAIHQEMSRALDAEGITTTILRTPEAKGEGNPFEPLTAEARKAIEERQAALYAQFVSDVAHGRRTSDARVRSDYGGGRVLTAADALAAGMVDRIETLDHAIARLSSAAAGGRGQRAASEWIDLESTAAPVHHTAIAGGPLDAAELHGMTPDRLRESHAWTDPDGDQADPASHLLPHHGADGSASLEACAAAIAEIPSSRLPAADRRAAWEHLAAHLRDGGLEPPELPGQPPASERVSAVATELVELVAWAQSRSRLRASEGRPRLSTRTESAFRAIRDSIDALLSGDPGAGAVTAPPVQPAAPAAPPIQRKAPSRDEFLASLAQRR